MTESLLNSLDSPEKVEAIATNLLRHYSFELGGATVEQLLARWSAIYPLQWILLATVEALYQGRYKAISVAQILAFWQRRGQPLPHFNCDFERLVSQKFPQSLLNHEPKANLPAPTESMRGLEAVRSHQFFANLKHLLLEGAERETAKFSLMSGLSSAHQAVAAPTPYRPNWLADADTKEPIRQFMPAPDLPEFHAKLKAVAQSDSLETDHPNASSATPLDTTTSIPPEGKSSEQADLENGE